LSDYNKRRLDKLPNQRNEAELYSPIVETMKSVFDRWYLEESQVYTKQGLQYNLTTAIKNPHLEVTAKGNFSEILKSHFDITMFGKLYGEELHPDIMGFVTKKKTGKPELITFEVKLDDLKIRDVMQARLYEVFFKSKLTFLLSPNGISREKIEAIMQHDEFLRGHVIIGKCGENGKDFRIDPKLKDKIPKEFLRFCRI
jgi:hypothetical protein